MPERKGPIAMVKRWSAVALAFLLMGSVAACGEEESASEQAEEAAEEAADSAEEAAEEAGDAAEESTD
jgi:hypothetical protein